MGNIQNLNQLVKFLEYVLGRCPEEFGLIPDDDGWFPTKELLQALSEEEGWRNVRHASINEIRLSKWGSLFEIEDNRIRAVERSHLSEKMPAPEAPKLLYTGITRKSYPVVLEKGICPTRYPQVILASAREMAERIASRRDPMPVILTVNTDQATAAGTVFYQFADTLFTAAEIPAGAFSGPPLPKEKEPPAKKPAPEEDWEKKWQAGTFAMKIPPTAGHKRDREKPAAGSWKRDKKRIRREKQKQWPGADKY